MERVRALSGLFHGSANPIHENSKLPPKPLTYFYHYIGGNDFNIWILEGHKRLVHNRWIDDDAGNGEEVINFYGGGKVGFGEKNTSDQYKEVYLNLPLWCQVLTINLNNN